MILSRIGMCIYSVCECEKKEKLLGWCGVDCEWEIQSHSSQWRNVRIRSKVGPLENCGNYIYQPDKIGVRRDELTFGELRGKAVNYSHRSGITKKLKPKF